VDWQDQDKSRDCYRLGSLRPCVSSRSHNHDTSCHSEDGADSDKQNLNASFPTARPDAGNERRTGLCSGKELPPVRLAEEYIRDANREEKPSEVQVVWPRSEHINHEGHPDSEKHQQSDNPAHKELIYLCSKSTGAVTSCTRKYLASAGYFRATASYIA
jgi:hypothetical protein